MFGILHEREAEQLHRAEELEEAKRLASAVCEVQEKQRVARQGLEESLESLEAERRERARLDQERRSAGAHHASDASSS